MATKLASSISRSKSSSSVESLPDRRQSQKSLACCCLVRATSNPGGDAKRQCVIIDLGEKASKALQSSCDPPLALLTENHASNIEEWKLHVGCSCLGESPKRSVKLQLRKKHFSRCESCCVTSRPVHGHWSLFVLAQEFVTTMLSKLRHLFFPLLPGLELEDLLKSNRHFCMYNPEEGVAETQIAIQPVNTTPETVKSLESDVKAYKETSLLMFQPTLPAVMDASYFGSPIYCIDDHSPDGAQFWLLGMVCSISQPKGGPIISAKADSVQLFASTIFHIIHSAISDGTHLELIPCLAYLSDTFECRQMYTCQNEAVTKLIVCLERGNYKEKLDLTQSIELVIFLLEKMPPLVDVSRKPSITSQKALKIQQHAKLLTTTFSCFRGVDPAEISQASYSGGPSILHKLVGDLCKQILRLMECSTEYEEEREEVIQAGFELWKEVLHFTYPEGPALQLTSDGALETARELWERDKYKQNAAIQRSYATILQKFCQQEKSTRDERQQLLEKIQEKETQLLAVKGENESKQQVIDYQKIENERLKAEQKQWHQEKVTLIQDRDQLQQEEQRWLREREELKEEGKQQQQKFHDLEQQLQEKMKQKEDLDREKEEKIQEKETQLLAVKGENDSKQQVIDYQKIENEQLKAEQKQWHQEKVTLIQDRDQLQQEEQRWLRERKELKEEGKQQQQKFRDLEQQLQEKMKDLERENKKLYSDLAVHKQEMEQLKAKNRMLSEDTNKKDKDLDYLKQQLERSEQVLKLQQDSVLNWQQKRNSPALRTRHKTVPFGSPPSSPFMAHRTHRPSLASSEGDKDFWERDMSKLLEEDLGLREAVCQLFRKVEGGSGEGTWEHLLCHLRKRFDVKMDAAKLETRPIGDIMQSIVQEWARKEAVTVRLFSDICSKKLGVPRVEEIMKEAFVKLKSQSNISY